MVCGCQCVSWSTAEVERNLECSGTATALKRAVSEEGAETNTFSDSICCPVFPSSFLLLCSANVRRHLMNSRVAQVFEERTSSRDQCATSVTDC